MSALHEIRSCSAQRASMAAAQHLIDNMEDPAWSLEADRREAAREAEIARIAEQVTATAHALYTFSERFEEADWLLLMTAVLEEVKSPKPSRFALAIWPTLVKHLEAEADARKAA